MEASIAHRISAAVISFSLIMQSTFAWGQLRESSAAGIDIKAPQQTAEYIFRNTPRDNLIAIQLFGSVERPGLYYVPEDTDLMKLLILSGGVLNSAEMEEIIVRKSGKSWLGLEMKYIEQKSPQTYEVNVDSLLREAPALRPLRLEHQDFVYVPQKTSMISNDVSKVVTIGSVLLTAILTGLLINERSK
ncbi:MAG: hypothetical protein V4736_09350 [Bdellovibrionota bacterium]